MPSVRFLTEDIFHCVKETLKITGIIFNVLVFALLLYYVLRINLFPHNGHVISILPFPFGTRILRPHPLQR